MRKAVTTQEQVSKLFDTHMVREAVQVANSLVRLARDRKANGLRSLEACMPQTKSPEPSTDPPIPGLDDPMMWSWVDVQFGVMVDRYAVEAGLSIYTEKSSGIDGTCMTETYVLMRKNWSHQLIYI